MLIISTYNLKFQVMEQNFKRIKETEVRTEHLHVEAFEMHHTKKYGVLGWYGDEQAAFLMEFDSVQDLSDYYCTDNESWMGIDEIEVGERVTDSAGTMYMRIW